MKVRLIIWMLLVLGSMSFTLLGPTTPAWACSCVDRTDAERFEGATQVFIGTPVLVTDGDPVVWDFTVESVQKGEVTRIQTVAIDRHEVEGCSFNFVAELRYQVFAGERDGVLKTGTCSGSRDLTTGIAAYLPAESTPSGGTAPPNAPPSTPPQTPSNPSGASDTTEPPIDEEPSELPSPTQERDANGPSQPEAVDTTTPQPIAQANEVDGSGDSLTMAAALAALLAAALLVGRSIRRRH